MTLRATKEALALFLASVLLLPSASSAQLLRAAAAETASAVRSAPAPIFGSAPSLLAAPALSSPVTLAAPAVAAVPALSASPAAAAAAAPAASAPVLAQTQGFAARLDLSHDPGSRARAARSLDFLFTGAVAAAEPAEDVVTDDELLASAIFLSAGAKPERLSAETIDALKRAANVRDASQLSEPAVLARLQASLRGRMGREAFETGAGAVAAGVRAAVSAEAATPSRSRRDASDLLRGWGWKLLPDQDPAFAEPRYLARLLRESGAGGRVLNLDQPQGWTEPWKEFAAAWRAIAPASVDPRSIQFALTGTDANNSL